MEVLLERCAGMDVHQETIVVCVMTTDAAGEAHSEIRSFGTMTKHLFELLKYLESQGVTHIAMESTGIYWKPVYNILEGY
ncbi:IS110 family transposase, partial [Paenibacillus dendritiformis]